MFRFQTLALISSLTTVGLWGAMNTTDQQFAKKAAQGGRAEVELGQLAVSKAGNQQVKAFGQRMVDDHSKANDKLKGIAAKENVTLPSEMTSKDRALKAKLSKLSGAAFDKAYMSAMVNDHQMDVSEFQKEANNGSDSDLKSFASDTLPTLQQHLDLAKTAASAVGANQ